MKFPAPIAIAILGFAAIAQAETSPITVTVEQSSKSESDKFKKTQHRALKITLKNSGKDDVVVKVKYALFGADANTHVISPVTVSELPATVHPASDVTLTTSEIKSEFTEEHYEKAKKVDAAGKRFKGYGVQVFSGGKVIAEAYDPDAMKMEMAKIPPPKPAGKPAPKK